MADNAPGGPQGPLGIIAGNGGLPGRVIERCRAAGREVFVLALEGEADREAVETVPHAWCRIGAAASGLDLLRANSVGELVLAGGVRRPSLMALRPDWRAAKFLARVGYRALGDDGVLSAVVKELEREGFRVIGADQLLDEAGLPEGPLGRVRPDADADADIAQGMRLARAIGALDIGQAVVVQQGLVLGVEAIEGTDGLLRRCAELRRDGPGGVLVKVEKPGQERRADRPVIGPQTVVLAAESGLRGIAAEAGATLVLDRDEVIRLADAAGLFVVGIRMNAADAAPFLFIIAGEPSGDVLGAALIAALRERTSGRLRIAGIGGEQMAAQGLASLVPIADLAVAGVTEVLPRVPLILRRVRETLGAIRALRPDAVITIDSSGFSWRIAQRLRRQGEELPLIHYVAPMVWAWRSGRARRMARWYDHLLTLLPFEPAYFERVGLAASYVGHPVIESGADKGDAARFRARHGIAADELIISVLPGSRGGEVRRLVPIFGEALVRLERMVGPFRVAVPTVATVAEWVSEAVSHWPGRPIVVRGATDKYDAFAASRAALAASGTVALELALAGVPMTVAYRLNPLTEALLDRILKVRQVNLINLLLERPLVAEHLRRACAPEPLAAALAELIGDERVRSAHRQGYDEAVRRLRADGMSPSRAAADCILAILAARRGDPSGDCSREHIVPQREGATSS